MLLERNAFDLIALFSQCNFSSTRFKDCYRILNFDAIIRISVIKPRLFPF